LCETVTITGFSKFTCLTSAVEVAPTDVLKLVIGSAQKACGNVDPKKCALTQTIKSSPEITEAKMAGKVMTLTGANFPTSGYSAKFVF